MWVWCFRAIHMAGAALTPSYLIYLPHVLVWSLENSRTAGAPSRPEKPASGSEMEPARGTADLSVSPSPEASGNHDGSQTTSHARQTMPAGPMLSPSIRELAEAATILVHPGPS